MGKAFTIAVCLCLFVVPALFADVFPVQVQGNEATTEINLNGIYQVSLTIAFENVTGLNSNALTVSAVQVSSADLISRLSDPSLITLPGQLPIVISISPSPNSNLSFTGVYSIELHTTSLTFNTALRLFTSHQGGTFEDITNFSGVGSYRVHGTGGRFSDFVILADVRTNDTVIQSKFSGLQSSLNANSQSIAAGMLQNLQAKYNAALLAYQSGDKTGAVSTLTSMDDLIAADNGASMPYRYVANDSTKKNVGGELRKIIATLIFSLRL